MKYIIDEYWAIALDGLRMVARRDGYGEQFKIEIAYKGQTFEKVYRDKAARDETFQRICDALDQGHVKFPGFSNEQS